jgi:hypothetical protein
MRRKTPKKPRSCPIREMSWRRQLGPEFVALAGESNKLEPNSEEAKEIGLILDKLDELCGDQQQRG